MDCEQVHRRVYEYLDGELTVWKRRAIARHLDACPPCKDGFAFELDLRRVYVAKCVEECPEALKRKIAVQLGIVVETSESSGAGAPPE